MKWNQYLLENRHLLWALLLATIIFGTAAYNSLPVQLFPDTAAPLVNIVTPYPGATAEDVARDVSRPLEEELVSLEGVVSVQSNSEDNLSIITLEFTYGRNAELAAIDAQNAVARLSDELPQTIGEPQVLSFDTSDRPVITFGLVGPDLLEARRQAEDLIAPRLQRLPGVAAVDVFGGRQEAVIIEIDKARLAAHKISIEYIVQELSRQNTAQPAGRIQTERRETVFRIETRAQSVEELEQTPLYLPDDSRILLRDIASINIDYLDEEAHFAIDGVRAIGMQIFPTPDANTVDVVHRSQEAADKLNRELNTLLGDGYQLVVGEESASFTETSVGNLFSNILQAILLAALIIFFFLGRFGASLIAAVSMPLSYGLTFIGMQLFGLEFNMVTLSAVILAVGMVVDASVVVLENIIRLQDEGYPPLQAALEGSAEVTTAVLAGAATTTAVLVPILLVPGFVGATFGPLALTLLLAFLSSVAVALMVVPLLSLYIGAKSLDSNQASGIADKITAPFRALMDKVRALYVFVLKKALNQRTLTLIVALATFVMGVKGIQARGMEVLPKMDGGSTYISFETPSGTSLQATSAVAEEIEALLANEPEIIKIQRQTGYERGMRSFSATGAQGSTQGFITVLLSPRTTREESIWSIQDRLRESISTIPEVQNLVVRELGNTAKSTTAAPVGIRLSGDDPLVLDRLADDILETLDGVEGLVDPVRAWSIDKHRFRVEVDPTRAAEVGLSPQQVGVQMQSGSRGLPAGNFFGDRPQSVPIMVRYAARQSPSELLDFPILIPSTQEVIPLRAIADLVDEIGPALVTRENLAQTLDISAQTSGRPLNFIVADIEELMNTLQIPQGYELEITGERGDLDEARNGLGRALLIALGAVYLLLLAQLRSFTLPLVIMASVPLSLVGVSAALGLASSPVSMPVMVGLILLVGIVVNNAIILLDIVSQMRASGTRRREALISAVDLRFRPIMMTSLSTVVGMIPLAAAWALGSERFSPLAIAVMGGMIASTLLTMIVIPVFYDVVESITEIPKRLFTSKLDPEIK